MIESPSVGALNAATEKAISGVDYDRRLNKLTHRNAWRILPFLLLGYIMNSLDKSNVGFASLEMNKALGFSPAVFGLGASLFFLTYAFCEIPSNLMMRRYGARRWLARILISWGLISAATALTHNATSFYVIRLALGIAEAGWFPGILFYMSLWFPRRFLARAVMLCYVGFPLSAILGYPISGMLLSMPSIGGLANWQWLFILEGLPCVLLGIFGLFWLKDTPRQATWLTADDKAFLMRALDTGESSRAEDANPPLSRTFLNSHVMLFALVNFIAAIGMYGVVIWIPRLVKDFGGLNNLEVGLIGAIPFIFGALCVAMCAYNSDRTRDRKWHVAVMLFIGGASMACALFVKSPVAMMVCVTLAMIGPFGIGGAWYAMVTDALRKSTGSGRATAVGIAAVTCIGNLGGFAGPYGIGLFVNAFGDFKYALVAVGSLLMLGGLIIALCKKNFLEPGRESDASV